MKRAGVAGAGIVLALVLAPAAAPQAPGVSCSRLDDGTLLIVHRSQSFPPTIKRDGERIAVTDDVGDEYSCSGVTPTVRNVDTIDYASKANIDGLTIDLAHGRLGPGATDEGDGSSEIEVDAQLGRDKPVLTIYGSGRRERITIGRMAGGEGALNLNAAESNDDPDVLFSAAKERVDVDLGVGRDFYSSAETDGFDGPYRGEATAIGGPEHDRLVGGPERDVLVGDTGRDTMLGGGGRDILFGDEYGPEPDFEQLIAADRLLCGAGRDRAYVDPADHPAGCERVRVRKPE